MQLRDPLNPRGLPRSNALLWRCFRYFSKQIDALDVGVGNAGEEVAKVLSETVARRLLFILITVDDELDAYTLFETLNARGLDLTTTDLLKNYLFSKMRARPDIDALKRRWQALIGTITQERFPDFLRHHLLCEHPEIRCQRLFKLVRDRVRTPEQTFEFMTALEGRAELFAALGDVSHGYWIDRPAARPFVRELNLFGVRQLTPVLFAAWGRFSDDDFVRLLKLAGVIAFRYSVVGGLNPNPLERVCHLAAKAVLDGQANRPGAVFRRLGPIYVEDERFESDFARWAVGARGRRGTTGEVRARQAGGGRRRAGRRPGDRPRNGRARAAREPGRRVGRGVPAGAVGGGGRPPGEPDAARTGAEPGGRKRGVPGQAGRVRVEHVRADAGNRRPRARRMDAGAARRAPAAARGAGRAPVAGGFLVGAAALRSGSPFRGPHRRRPSARRPARGRRRRWFDGRSAPSGPAPGHPALPPSIRGRIPAGADRRICRPETGAPAARSARAASRDVTRPGAHALWYNGRSTERRMDISRRTFIKAAAGGAVGVSALGFDLRPAHAAVRQLKIRNATEYRTVCPYCAVGCGTIAYVHGSGGLNTKNTVIHVEGDPDSPINGGTLCPKGASQMELAISPRLRHQPLLRRAGAADWEEVDWDTAMDWFARKFKDSRDASFRQRDDAGRVVNRADGIAWVGSATVSNEDAYLITKTMRAMGLVYIDHQARI